MNPTEYSFEETINFKYSLLTFPINDDIVAYRFTQKSKLINSEREKFRNGIKGKNTTREGFANTIDVKKFILAKSNSILPNEYFLTIDLNLFKKTLCETSDKLWEVIEKVGIEKTPYTIISANPAEIERVFYYDNYYGCFRDHQKRIIPHLLQFGYIFAYIDNARYDLPKVVKILSKNPRVTFDDPKNPISLIPYYNQNEKSTQTVEFKWCPTEKELVQLVSKYTDNPHNWYRGIFEFDFLGIREAH